MPSHFEPLNWPKLSIIVPSFNQNRFLSSTLDSILNQQYPNLELIVIDGGSTDGSVETINNYSSRISYWESGVDGGHASALINGFSRSSGEIMAWINSDDFYMPWSFKIVACLFEQFKNVEWLTGRGTTGSVQNCVLQEEHDRKNLFSFLVGDYGWIQQESTFWRRTLWEKSKVQITLNLTPSTMMIDSLFWCCFFQHASLYNADVHLACYRKHSVNKAEVLSAQAALETDYYIRTYLLTACPLRMLWLVAAYRVFRQLISLYPVRIIFNTNSLQQFFAHILNPPPFRVLYFSRKHSVWVEKEELFRFKLYKPHALAQLSGFIAQRCSTFFSFEMTSAE